MARGEHASLKRACQSGYLDSGVCLPRRRGAAHRHTFRRSSRAEPRGWCAHLSREAGPPRLMATEWPYQPEKGAREWDEGTG